MAKRRAAWMVAFVAMGWVAPATAQETTLTFEGEVPTDGDFFVIEFEVPSGIGEIEVRHDDLSDANILDWGLMDPNGFRGYGGGNTEPAIVGEQAASRSYLPGPMTPGTWRVYVGKAKIDEEPARYHVEVVLREPTATTLDPQPEREPYAPAGPLSTEARWYAGDFHVHSQQSGDASPSLEEVASFAEARGLDFVMVSDHNTVAQLELYGAVQQSHPELLLVPGIEVTTYAGHVNAIGATEWVDHRLGYRGLTAENVADAVHEQGALFSITHPVLDLGDACIGCAWTANVDAAKIDGVEVQTGGFDVTGELFFDRAVGFWEELAVEGHHVAAVGGSDDHQAGQGTGGLDSPIGSPTTMVWAEELSADAIREGVQAGRTVVKLQGPDDPMVELGAAEPLDGDAVVGDTVTLRLRVTGGDGTTVHLIHNGVRGEPIAVTGSPFEVERTVDAPPSGEDFYRAELMMLGRPRVITSHLFVRPATPGGTGEPSGGGCTLTPPAGAGSASIAAGLAALWVFAVATRRRGGRSRARRG